MKCNVDILFLLLLHMKILLLKYLIKRLIKEKVDLLHNGMLLQKLLKYLNYNSLTIVTNVLQDR